MDISGRHIYGHNFAVVENNSSLKKNQAPVNSLKLSNAIKQITERRSLTIDKLS